MNIGIYWRGESNIADDNSGKQEQPAFGFCYPKLSNDAQFVISLFQQHDIQIISDSYVFFIEEPE